VFWIVTVVLALATIVLSYVFAKQPPPGPVPSKPPEEKPDK
jgi:hypothetical protein